MSSRPAPEVAPAAEATDLPPLAYLTVDSVIEGVGTSQVLPYVTRLAARGLPVELHTFERRPPPDGLANRLDRLGVAWRAHRFRGRGATGGMARVVEGAAAIRGRALVHCRSDLPAASALLGRPTRWVWDVRSFWADQRIELGLMRRGGTDERALRLVERSSARQADGIVVLASAAATELARRHPGLDPGRVTVVPTCADLAHFQPAPLPAPEPLVVLLSGSFNRLYDLATTVRLVEQLRARVPTTVRVLRTAASPADDPLAALGATARSVPFASMPREIRGAHLGLALLRTAEVGAGAGAVPTKVAEFLACGRPVVVNRGLGDFDELLPTSGAGVVLGGDGPDDVERGVDEVLALLADPATPGRCRDLAARHFDLDSAVDRLLGVYRRAVTAG